MAHTAKVLTIAVAAYNVAPYIAQCLDSFVDEKLLPALDIVVIDDGSTDATAHIVKKYINRYTISSVMVLAMVFVCAFATLFRRKMVVMVPRSIMRWHWHRENISRQ